MGGQTQQTTNTSQTTQATPYRPAEPYIRDIVNQAGSQLSNTGLNSTETGALDQLSQNAQGGNPYAAQIGSLATDLLNGGTDRSGYITDAYKQLQSGLQPFATMSTNPYENQAFKTLSDTMTSDIQDRINSAYAGAGMTGTGAGDYGQQLGRGITQGLAPTAWQAYNDLSGQKLGAINALYQGGNTTGGLLSGLDQTALANRQAGVGAASSALQARDAPYQRLLEIESQRRGIPLQNISNISSLISPLAQSFGTTTTSGQSNSTTQVPLSQQIAGIGLGAAGLLGGMGGWGGMTSGIGQGLGLLGSLFGNAR